MVGTCALPRLARLQHPFRNPDIDRPAQDLRHRQTKTLAPGIDLITADLRDTMQEPAPDISGHGHVIAFLCDHPRPPRPGEPCTAWLAGAESQRACLRASETAVVIANCIRLLGHDVKAHTATSSDVDLHRLTLAAGLASLENGVLVNPCAGTRFDVAAVTTTFDIAHNAPLAPQAQQPRWRTHGPAWWLGKGQAKSALIPPYVPGAHAYTCGPDRHMNSVMQSAETAGYPETARHLEYLAAPEAPERENHPFTLHLARSGRDVAVAADKTASDALIAAGVAVDLKCSDGICGVCKCAVLSGEVDHRDFVLSAAQRKGQMILCQSRAEHPGGTLTLDL